MYLLIVLCEWSSVGVLVDGLHHTDDFTNTVADGHAQNGLSLIARQLVNFITEPMVLHNTQEAQQCGSMQKSITVL